MQFKKTIPCLLLSLVVSTTFAQDIRVDNGDSKWWDSGPTYDINYANQCIKFDHIPAGLWGNRMRVLSIQEQENSDGDSVTITGNYEDESVSKFVFYKTMEACQKTLTIKNLALTSNAASANPSTSTNLISLVAENGFPPIKDKGFFNSCSVFNSNNPGEPEYVACDEIELHSCPYSPAGCSVQGEFVNGKLRLLSFNYEYGAVDGASMKNKFDEKYGYSSVSQKSPNSLPINSWSSSWKKENIEVKIMRFEGININRESYNTVIVSFIDTSLPKP